MNKELRSLQAKMQQKNELMKGYLTGENRDLEKAKDLQKQLKEDQEAYELLKSAFEADKQLDAPTLTEIETAAVAKEVDGFEVISKMAKNQVLSPSEKAAAPLIVNGTNGEANLVPSDVQTQIKTLRETHKSARGHVTVIPTTYIQGSQTYEVNENPTLYPLVDGVAVTEGESPQYVTKAWSIKFFGRLLNVSNLLEKAERAGLMASINRFFMRAAVNTENNSIFGAIAPSTGTYDNVIGATALKDALNDLDPAFLIDAAIITNQSGWKLLDAEHWADGKPALESDLQKRTRKVFQDLPVDVFPDAQLPNINGKPVIIMGSTIAGVEMRDYDQYSFAISDQFKFDMNQKTMRIIAGHCVNVIDAKAFKVVTFESTPPAVGGGAEGFSLLNTTAEQFKASQEVNAEPAKAPAKKKTPAKDPVAPEETVAPEKPAEK